MVPEVFDREWERGELARFAASSGLGVVSGRRRHGKSFLLRSLADQAGAWYHQAIEVDRRPAIDRFAAALAVRHRWPAPPQFHDWETALRAAFAHDDEFLILDEFPYLLRSAPELLSVIQLLADEWRALGRRHRLILCGSSLSVMASVLGAQSPLHGRATLDLRVDAFDFRLSARFWGVDDVHLAFTVDAFVGGAPGYKELLGGGPPSSLAELGPWLASGPLNPAHVLFSEDDYLLREEAHLTDRAHYLSMLQAIAAGASTTSSLAAALGRDARSLHHSLNGLVRAGFVESIDDALRDQRPTLRLVDPLVRLCRLVTRPATERLEQHRWPEVLDERMAAIESGIYGPHFEHLAREWVRRFASADELGDTPTRCAPGVLSDRAEKQKVQLDVVAVRSGFGERPAVVAIGEAKYTRRPRHLGDLARLDAARQLLRATRGAAFDTSATRLLLFSAFGFEAELSAEAKRRGEVELVDLDRLYGR